MASGETLKRIRTYYAKMELEMQQWRDTHNIAQSHVGTIVNMLQRMPVLLKDSNYGSLLGIDGIQDDLLDAHIKAIERVYREVKQDIELLMECSRNMEKIYQNACHSIQQNARLTRAVRCRASGPVPSIDACLEGLHLMSLMYGHESYLSQLFVAELGLDNDDSKYMKHIHAFFQELHCIDEGRIQDILYVMQCTEEQQTL